MALVVTAYNLSHDEDSRPAEHRGASADDPVARAT